MISRLKKNQRILLSGALVLLGCVLLIVSIVSFDAEYELGDSFLMVCSRFGVLAVCVALAVLLYEIDSCGIEHKRGLKTITVPAHTRKDCHHVTVRCIKFVLPEDLDVSGSAASICGCRRFRVKFIANYIDNDFECCEVVI